MAKISELPQLLPAVVDGTETIPVVKNGLTLQSPTGPLFAPFLTAAANSARDAGLYRLQQAFRIENRNAYAPVAPSARWNGNAGSGFTAIPTAPARVTGAPPCLLVTVPGVSFTDAETVGVMAFANNSGGMDNEGIEKVVFHYEGNTVEVTSPSFYSWIDANGRPRTLYAWWATLLHNGIVGQKNVANLYVEAIPKNPALQSRVIGPYPYNPRNTLYDKVLEIAPLQPQVAGVRYQTPGAAFDHLRGSAAWNSKLVYVESGTYPSSVFDVPSTIPYAQTCGFTTIEAAPGIEVTFDNPVGTTGKIYPRATCMRFRGKGIRFNMDRIWEIDGDYSGLRQQWLDGCHVFASPGGLWDGGMRPVSFVVEGAPYFTECSFENVEYPTYGAQLARFVSGKGIYNDVWTGARCVVGCDVTTENAPYRTEDPAFTVQYTGAAASATLAISGKPGEARTFTLNIGGTVSQWGAAITGGNAATNYYMPQLVSWLNTIPGIVATLDSARWSARYVGRAGAGDAATPATDIKAAPVAFKARAYPHSDLYQWLGASPNFIVAYNSAFNLDVQILIQGNPARDQAWVGNTFHQTSGYNCRFASAVEHLIFVGNSLNYPLYVDLPPDAHTLIANNVVSVMTGHTAESASYRNNHAMVSTGRQKTQVGYSDGGTVLTLFANVSGGDFTPAGALLTNLKPVAARYDRNGLKRASPCAAGAIS